MNKQTNKQTNKRSSKKKQQQQQKNKKILSDLLEKEKANRENQNEAYDDTDSNDGGDREETASEVTSEAVTVSPTTKKSFK